MNFQEIKQLIKVVEKSDIGEIEIVEEGSKVRITKNRNYDQPPVNAGDNTGGTPQIVMQPPQPSMVPGQPAPAVEATEPQLKENTVEVKSPMVGTFYRSPAPDADPYVQVGDTIKVGQTLCIIEAMKLMNEIQSEVSGKIVKIMVENAQPVEYDHVLFLIEKN
ncbi:MAG: acetyl-CoA carboxylase biotin carboxyl carrier protein [Calditrichia bacterium]